MQNETDNSQPQADNPNEQPLARFVISEDGTEVTDNKTGLIWRRCPEGMTASVDGCTGIPGVYNLEEALALAKSEAKATRQAWRLPKVEELSSIVDMSRRDPSIDTDVFPGTPGSAFFTSSPDGALSWFVSFYVGKVFSEYNAIPNHVRLVRSS
ncbi:MAG: Protein of unknown function (DUF1566) [Candidatus Nitrotoga sp. LAW]|nr:MAG: Protein of unknown function (DUF1566) [Candidatus Nitrotoga sp. LAW]